MVAGPSSVVKLVNLGRMRYMPALRLQERMVNAVKEARNSPSSEAPDTLLVVEHDPVYTTGIRTRDYGPAEERRLRSLGADFVRTDRGGLITFHGPGQLVVYPILDLERFFPVSSARKRLLGVKWYVHRLEQTVIDALDEMGLEGWRSPHTGVWIKRDGEQAEEKVCALGVHNSGLVTSHGIALNCCVDMVHTFIC